MMATEDWWGNSNYQKAPLHLMHYLFSGELATRFVNQLFQDLLEWSA